MAIRRPVALTTRFSNPSSIPASDILLPPTVSGCSAAARRPMKPAMMAGIPVKGPRHRRMPQTSATTEAVLAGGRSPRGSPVLGSMLIACIAIVSGEPVIGLGGPLGLPGGEAP
jgi:hypothetical protein